MKRGEATGPGGIAAARECSKVMDMVWVCAVQQGLLAVRVMRPWCGAAVGVPSIRYLGGDVESEKQAERGVPRCRCGCWYWWAWAGAHTSKRRKEGGGKRQRDQEKEAATEKSEAAKNALGVGRARGEFSETQTK